MESSDLAAQISPSTISPAPGTSPNSYTSTVNICDNYENYLAPYLKPVYQAIPRTFPLVGPPPQKKIDKSCATLGPWDILLKKKLNLGQPHDSSLAQPASLWCCRCLAMAAWSPRFVCPFCECWPEETSRCILAESQEPRADFFVTRFGVKPLNCPFKSVWNP